MDGERVWMKKTTPT